MARFPAHVPNEQTRQQVLMMTGFGILQEDIGTMLGVTARTLRTHYRHELDTGRTEANVRVAKSLFEMATKDKVVSAAIFWLKSRAGWKETTVQENTGPGGGPVMVVTGVYREADAAPQIEGEAFTYDADDIEAH